MIFKPTGTSEALIKAVRPFIKGGKLLDLGCGCGIVGKTLLGLCSKYYASDISQDAIDVITDPDIDARCGSLFEPWQGMKFNFIVDDVSGVAESIAKVSPWFEGVPTAGEDGANLICEVLIQAPEYLEKNGILFFPIVSLSNIDRILKLANHLYKVELLSHNEFPLPKEMYKHIDLITKVKGAKLKERFGILIFWTDIYMAKSRGSGGNP